MNKLSEIIIITLRFKIQISQNHFTFLTPPQDLFHPNSFEFSLSSNSKSRQVWAESRWKRNEVEQRSALIIIVRWGNQSCPIDVLLACVDHEIFLPRICMTWYGKKKKKRKRARINGSPIQTVRFYPRTRASTPPIFRGETRRRVCSLGGCFWCIVVISAIH